MFHARNDTKDDLERVSIKARFLARDDTKDNLKGSVSMPNSSTRMIQKIILKGVSIKARFLVRDDTKDNLERRQYQGQVPRQG